MFAFGFGGILVNTQLYGLCLKWWKRGAVFGLHISAALGVYSQRGWVRLNEIIRIPIIEYALVFTSRELIGFGLWLARKVRRSRL